MTSAVLMFSQKGIPEHAYLYHQSVSGVATALPQAEDATQVSRRQLQKHLGKQLARMATRSLYPRSSDVSIQYEEGGKPYGIVTSDQKQQNVALSITHTATVVAAIATRERCVGIDIEIVRELPDAVIQKFMIEREYQKMYIYTGAERLSYVMKCWCAKEAYLKALGVGLRKHPCSVSVQILDADPGHRVTVESDGFPMGMGYWTTIDDLYMLVAIFI